MELETSRQRTTSITGARLALTSARAGPDRARVRAARAIAKRGMISSCEGVGENRGLRIQDVPGGPNDCPYTQSVATDPRRKPRGNCLLPRAARGRMASRPPCYHRGALAGELRMTPR